jgi:hypothetical protein
MEIKIKLHDFEAILNQEGNWKCEDKGVESMLEKVKEAMPGTASVKHPLIQLAEWEMEVLGGKVISVEDDQMLREGAVY